MPAAQIRTSQSTAWAACSPSGVPNATWTNAAISSTAKTSIVSRASEMPGVWAGGASTIEDGYQAARPIAR